MAKKVVVVGGGIGGLATAALLADRGYEVAVYEKNSRLGGRANRLEVKGFTFDMGPSWYLMPDVFEHFFALLGEKISDHLKLDKIEPSYRVFFKDTGKKLSLYTEPHRLAELFESLEKGSSAKLEEYLKQSEEHYRIAMGQFIYKNYDSFTDFFSLRLIQEGLKLKIFSKMQNYVEKYFKSPEIHKIMQYPLVFLGNSPYNAPALYNLMSYVDFGQGVFYPQGGIYEIIKALVRIGEKRGVKFFAGKPVKEILEANGQAKGIRLDDGQEIGADMVISNADLHHTEQALIKNPGLRDHSEQYWQSRVMAPSGFIGYLGVKGKLPQLEHHNLIFSLDWRKNFGQIFDYPQWPDDPSMYVCMPSAVDPSTAPEGHENIFIFVPIASGLPENESIRQEFAKKILAVIAKEANILDLEERIVYKQWFSGKGFETKYNSFKGSALGLAHTLWQTAIFRPNNVSKKIKNLFYVGGNTNPGIGLPMCLISAELALKRIIGDRSSGPLTKS